MRTRVLAASVAVSVAVAATAAAAPPAAPAPEPSGPHPRMLLDAELRAAWRAEAAANRGAVAGAIRVCREAATTKRYEGEGYQGWAWAQALQSCLVAWAATDAPEHAAAALRYFTALLDDLEVLGDGKGGDASAQRDDGYAIRNLGPFTALAYDWLHDAPGMTPELRARARSRWDAWLTWYRAHGYRARGAGTNYHAGFLAAATLIAVAQAGEAGEAGARLWRFVADEMWGVDMAGALAPGGILDGGDWPEGWQYGPLAVANYALAARVARRAGISVAGVEGWLASVLRRHVHATSPADRIYAGGDTQRAAAHLEPNKLMMAAIALGDAAEHDRRLARGERVRQRLDDDEVLLFDALALLGGPRDEVRRAAWPTWYLARNTGALFARTRWDDRAVWIVAECQKKLASDHRHVNAGTFVLTRGRDDLIVDPSPYGSLSTLTGNAPTVASAQVPADVVPSQHRRGLVTGWRWATQTRSGVVAARCDYADQYRLDDRPSDIPEAVRDLIVVPSADGADASVVVVDRAVTGAGERGMYLRFHVPGAALALDGETGRATLGATKLAIAAVARSPGSGAGAGQPRLVTPTVGSCDGAPRGRCEAARFPVTDYRREVAGPEPRAVHVISATASGAAAAAVASRLDGDGWEGVHLAGPREAVVVWPRGSDAGATLRYRAPRGPAVTHVVLAASPASTPPRLVARPDRDTCAVELAIPASPTAPAASMRPVIAVLDAACAVTLDPERPSGSPADAAPSPTPPSPPPPPPPRPTGAGGCCGARGASAPTSSIATSTIVGLALLRRRRRCRQISSSSTSSRSTSGQP